MLDASAAAGALVMDTDQGLMAWARMRSDPDQHAPEFIYLEVLAVIRRRAARGEIDGSRADRAVSDLADLALVRYPHRALLPRIWERRHNLTPYDAAYVALAEALGAPLLTADAHLARAAGPRCAIELLA